MGGSPTNFIVSQKCVHLINDHLRKSNVIPSRVVMECNVSNSSNFWLAKFPVSLLAAVVLEHSLHQTHSVLRLMHVDEDLGVAQYSLHQFHIVVNLFHEGVDIKGVGDVLLQF